METLESTPQVWREVTSISNTRLPTDSEGNLNSSLATFPPRILTRSPGANAYMRLGHPTVRSPTT